MPESTLERTFDFYWNILGDGSTPDPDYRFHPKRKWKLDRAWPDVKVAVEIEGGIFARGRHTRGKGYHNDCVKYNAAVEDGWALIRVTTLHMDAPYTMIEQIKRVLKARRDETANRLQAD